MKKVNIQTMNSGIGLLLNNTFLKSETLSHLLERIYFIAFCKYKEVMV